MHSKMRVDPTPMTDSSTIGGAPDRPSCPREEHADAVQLERALPDMRARLNARYSEFGAAAVDACLSRAVDASVSFRLHEFRTILVERQAERDLRRLRQRPSLRRPLPR